MSESYSSRGRIAYWDYIKGIAIVLVVFGHSFYDYTNPLLLWIYSFHMPLFMIVSGYFFRFSAEKSARDIIRSRFIITVLPIFLTTFLLYFEKMSSSMNWTQHIHCFYGLFIRNLWFLWAVFFDSVLLLLIHKFVQNRFLRLILVFFVSLLFIFTPDFACQQGTKFMWPCFAFGYFLNDFSLVEFFKKHRLSVLLISSAVFYLMLIPFDRSYTFYSTGVYIFSGVFSPLRLLYIDVYRVIIGIAGSISLMSIVYELTQLKLNVSWLSQLLLKLGKKTLGIFIIHFFINYYLEKTCLGRPIQFSFLYSLLYTPLLLGISYFLSIWVERFLSLFKRHIS